MAVKKPEAQASDNNLLVFIQQWEGRSTEWPSFFVPFSGCLCRPLEGVVNQEEISAVLSNPMTAACWGMMLSALNPGTALTSMT